MESYRDVYGYSSHAWLEKKSDSIKKKQKEAFAWLSFIESKHFINWYRNQFFFADKEWLKQTALPFRKNRMQVFLA